LKEFNKYFSGKSKELSINLIFDTLSPGHFFPRSQAPAWEGIQKQK